MSEFLKSTMLIERSIGGLSYVIVIYMGYRGFINGKDVKRSLRTCLFLLVILAFFYIPGTSADLYRLREMTSSWGEMSFSTFYERHLSSTSIPVAYVYYYVCSKIGILGIMPAGCAFVYYMNAFHIFEKLYESKRYTHDSLALSFLLFMSSGAFLEVISDVRCFVSFSIVLRVVFDQIFFNKSFFKYLPIFLVAILLHPASSLIVIVWMGYYLFFAKKEQNLSSLANIVTVMMVGVLSYWFGRSFVQGIMTKAGDYLGGESYSYIWEYVIGFIQLGIFIFLLSRYKRINYDDKYEKTISISKIAFLFVFFELFLCFEYNTFHRYITALSFLMIPVSLEVFNNLHQESYRRNAFTYVQLLSYLIVLIACTRGNMCGFKFFLL